MIVGKLRWIIPAVVFLGLLAIVTVWWAESSRGELPVLGRVPAFEMTERDGQPFGREDLDGRISVVSWIFTNCPGVCPRMGEQMIQLYHDFAGSDKVQFVSISVDPDRDSLAALRAYAESWGVADKRWVFLRAPIEDVVDLCENGFMLPAVDLPGGHTFRFTLVDAEGYIRGYYDGTDAASVAILKDHMAMLVREMR
jgi:protein SCO1/2